MYPNTSDIGKRSAIGNRATSMIRANMQNQGTSRFMKNYQRIIRARNNMLNASRMAGGAGK